MQPIDYNKLIENRIKLVDWQTKQWNRVADGIRLHLGSGHLHLSSYVNVDPFTKESDSKDTMQTLSSFRPGSVTEIISQHSLEHIPIRQVYPTLKRWFELLKDGGTLELGMPDIELCFQLFLESNEQDRWNRYIWTVYGGQGNADSFPFADHTGLKADIPFEPGLVHYGGFTLGKMIRMLEDIGFRITDAYHYDGYGTPSYFIYAFKPQKGVYKSVLEQDVVIGTFTHRSDYIPKLWASVYKYLPQIPFITRFNRGNINEGMTKLRQDFIDSGKRYWVFLDDDIEFLNPDIINNALMNMVAGKYAAMSVFSTFDGTPKPYEELTKGLVCRETKWATGYFVMVDSRLVGHILPDMNLPDGNTAVDTSYSTAIRAEGFKIGISPDVVYHTRKDVWAKPEVIGVSNQYLFNKWGQLYFNVAQYDGNVLEWAI